MKAILHRLRRLEHLAAPNERELAAAEMIREAMRRCLGAEYKPIVYPPDWFVGYRGDAELINRAYEFLRKRPTNEPRSGLDLTYTSKTETAKQSARAASLAEISSKRV